jgi:hypothetical protein
MAMNQIEIPLPNFAYSREGWFHKGYFMSTSLCTFEIELRGWPMLVAANR